MADYLDLRGRATTLAEVKAALTAAREAGRDVVGLTVDACVLEGQMDDDHRAAAEDEPIISLFGVPTDVVGDGSA